MKPEWTIWKTGSITTAWAARWFIREPLTAFMITASDGWNTGACGLKQRVLEEENHQGVAVVNYTDRETPYTRIIEHKHFEFGTQPRTVVQRVCHRRE